MNTRNIGIDFGSTKTLVSYFNPSSGRYETVRLGHGQDYMPTSIFLSEEGEFFFGEEAEDQFEFAPHRHCRAFKTKLGSHLPVLSLIDSKGVLQYTARELTTTFLSHVKARVEGEVFMGESIEKVVITYPALFTPSQLEDLRAAAQEAGYRDVALITEPEAAGHAYCTMCPTEAFTGNALVVDWGGGTLDMALISRDGEGFRTHREHIAGDISLGGELFDELLWNHVCEEMFRLDRFDLRQEIPEMQYIQSKRTRQVKEMLSSKESQVLRLNSSQGARSPLTLTRAEFENIISPHIQKANEIAEKLMQGIASQHLRPEFFLLVGGSSQIPLIAQALEQSTQLPCKKWHLGREAVSLGAAICADTDASTPADKVEREVESSEVAALPQPQIQDPPSTPEYEAGIKDLYGITSIETDEVGVRHATYKKEVIDHTKAAESFSKGYTHGCNHCAYMLISLYWSGMGVAKNVKFALDLAEHLLRHDYYPAAIWLFLAYRTGEGRELEASKAREYSQLIKKQCMQTHALIKEEIRLDALFALNMCSQAKDFDQLQLIAEEYFRKSIAPARYGFLLLSKLGEATDIFSKDILELAQQGCEAFDTWSLLLRGNLYSNADAPIHDSKLAYEHYKEAFELGLTEAALSICTLPDRKEEAKDILAQYWKKSTWGVSELRAEHQLNCELSFVPADEVCLMQIVDEATTKLLAKQNALGNLIERVPPLLRIKNTGDDFIRGFVLKVSFQDKPHTIKKNMSLVIAPQEEITVNISKLDIEWGTEGYIEIIDREQSLGISISSDCTDYFFESRMPPVTIWCNTGILGNYTLSFESLSRKYISRIGVTKHQSGASIDFFGLSPSARKNIGWLDFSDNRNLRQDEPFFITFRDYGHITAFINTNI